MLALLLKIARAAIVSAQIVVIVAFMIRFVPLTCVPTFKKSELAGPPEEIEKCSRCGSEDITRKDGQIICTTCGKVIKETDGETDEEKMPIHEGEYSLPHPPTREGGSTRAETGEDVDIGSNGSSNFVPAGLSLHIDEKKEKEIAGKAKETRSENRVEECIKRGEGIMNSITPSIPRPAKKRFQESMERLAGEHGGFSGEKAMYGCIAYAYAQTPTISLNRIAQECNLSVGELRRCKRKVYDLLGETEEGQEYENKYERITIETLRRVGYKNKLLKLMAEREIKERKSERQGKDPNIYCAAVVYTLLDSVNKSISQREIEAKAGISRGAIAKMRYRHNSLDGLRIFEPTWEEEIEPRPGPSWPKMEKGKIKRKDVARPKKKQRKAKLKPVEPTESLPTYESMKIEPN